MKKKILSLCLVFVLALTAIGGTLAYFTDTDEATNVFTVGNIDIELRERSSEGQEWTSNKDYQEWLKTQTLMPGQTLAKYVTVANIGGNDAYIRVKITCPENITPNFREPWDMGFSVATTIVNADKSTTYVLTSPDPLPSMRESCILLESITLAPTVTEVNAQASYDVKVEVEAIQAETFADAAAAYAELDSKTKIAVTEAASTPNDLNKALDAGNKVVQLADDVKSNVALTMNKANTVLDGNGNALEVKNESTVAHNAGVAPTQGTIKNIKITGDNVTVGEGESATTKGFRAVYVTGALAGNLFIEDAELTGRYAINVNSKSEDYGLTVKNSKLNGWVSYAPLAYATFENVEFNTQKEYAVLKPYSDTTLTGCTFAVQNAANEKYVLCNGDKIDYLTITMNDVKVGDVTLTVANVAAKLDLTDFKGTLVINGVSLKVNVQ